MRHGLTAETVIVALENPEDYKAFEAAVAADFNTQSAVERELVLRLASLLWRLRRSTTIETGLFEMQAKHFRDFRQGDKIEPDSRKIVYAMFPRGEQIDWQFERRAQGIISGTDTTDTAPSSEPRPGEPTARLARCFLRLANLPNLALDRLSRYEAILWRQASQILFALDGLNRRKPQERIGRVKVDDC